MATTTKRVTQEYSAQARRIENLEQQILTISVGMNRLEVLKALSHLSQDILNEIMAERVAVYEE